MGIQLPLPKKEAEPPIFSPCLLWPSGWMDQDATWYGGRPRLRRHCVGWEPSSPPKNGIATQFLAHVYCGQTAVRIRIPLGTEVGLSLGDIVLYGDPVPPPLKGHSRQFSATVHCCQKAGWTKMALAMEVSLGPVNFVLDGIALPLKGIHPPVFGPCLLWPNGWTDEDATRYRSRPQPRPHCNRRGPSCP